MADIETFTHSDPKLTSAPIEVLNIIGQFVPKGSLMNLMTVNRKIYTSIEYNKIIQKMYCAMHLGRCSCLQNYFSSNMMNDMIPNQHSFSQSHKVDIHIDNTLELTEHANYVRYFSRVAAIQMNGIPPHGIMRRHFETFPLSFLFYKMSLKMSITTGNIENLKVFPIIFSKCTNLKKLYITLTFHYQLIPQIYQFLSSCINILKDFSLFKLIINFKIDYLGNGIQKTNIHRQKCEIRSNFVENFAIAMEKWKYSLSILDLKNLPLRTNESKKLFKSLANSINMHTIHYRSFAPLDEGEFRHLIHSLNSMPNLQIIELDNCMYFVNKVDEYPTTEFVQLIRKILQRNLRWYIQWNQFFENEDDGTVIVGRMNQIHGGLNRFYNKIMYYLTRTNLFD
jgi:hypothetical protein